MNQPLHKVDIKPRNNRFISPGVCETSKKAVKPLKTLGLSKSASIPIIYFFGIVVSAWGCHGSQQNWKELPLGFPICELTSFSLLSQAKANPWPKPYKREVRGGWSKRGVAVIEANFTVGRPYWRQVSPLSERKSWKRWRFPLKTECKRAYLIPWHPISNKTSMTRVVNPHLPDSFIQKLHKLPNFVWTVW